MGVSSEMLTGFFIFHCKTAGFLGVGRQNEHSQYEATKAERDRVAAEIRQKGIRRREFERFIATLEKLPEEVTTFEGAMWSSLVDYVTVSGKDDLQFTLACGVEMQA